MAAKLGEQHHKWKGDDAGITAIHLWIRKQLLKTLPLKCTECGSVENVEVASTTNHNYTRDVKDYTFLCRPCHIKKDGSQESRRLLRNGPARAYGTKKYAISAPSAAIALRYGENVSRGILKMDDKIEKLEKENKELKKK